MSSYYTTVRVSNEEWERMNRDIAAEEAYQIRSSQEIARLQRLQQERLQEISRIQESNRQVINRALDYITMSFNNNINQLSEDIRDQVITQSGSIDDQLNSIRSQAARLNTRISSSNAAIGRLAQEYSEVFQRIVNNNAQEQQRAEAILSELDNLIEEIRALHPELYLPNEYSGLLTIRSNTAVNIETGDHQAAIISSQQGILNASRILTTLIAANEQYDRCYADVLNRLIELRGRIDQYSSQDGVISAHVGNEVMEYDYDLGYWSHGTFDLINAAVNSINERMESGQIKPIPLSDLEELNTRINSLNEQLTRCDIEARQDFASAITVENTVARLHESLINRGCSLETSGHIDDDSRKPYTMIYEDGAGNPISFVIASGKDPEKPLIFFEAFADDTPTSDMIKDGIDGALESDGLQTERAVRRNDCSSNTSPEAFINNVTRETEQIEEARENQVRRNITL